VRVQVVFGHPLQAESMLSAQRKEPMWAGAGQEDVLEALDVRQQRLGAAGLERVVDLGSPRQPRIDQLDADLDINRLFLRL
jgi:hypothetical protein